MKPWLIRSRETILQRGIFLRVENHVVELPDGTVIPDWTWLVAPDYVNILPVTPDGGILLFRQFKYAVGEECLGIIGGYLEPGEAPLEGAQRELLEETGCRASRWIPLGSYVIDANRGVGKAHIFLALDAVPSSVQPVSDDLEEQKLIQLSRSELKNALFQGEFKVLPWAAAVGLALLRLDDFANNRQEY